MRHPSRFVLLSALSLIVVPGLAEPQSAPEVSSEQLFEVIAEAERFGPRQGDPPVWEAYATDAASGGEARVGFAFVTSDIPPEVRGYSAPITVLVGMDVQGTITGIEVLAYRESLRSSRGDFLNRGSFLSQFAGKNVVEPFRLREDIDGISGASITVDAMARGIRNAARRVAAAYLSGPPPDAAPRYIGTIEPEELDELLWAEMLNQGFATQLSVDEGPVQMVLSMVFLSRPAVGEMLVGETYFRSALDTLGTREPPKHTMLMGLGGRDPFFFRTSALSFEQDGESFPVPAEDLQMLPLLREGKLQGEVRRSAVVYADDALDLTRPFDVVLDLAPRGERGAATYQVMPPEIVATAPTTAPPAPEATGEASSPNDTEGVPEPDAGSEGAPLAGASGATSTPADAVDAVAADQPQAPPEIDFGSLLIEEEEEEQGAFARVLERTSWVRVGGFLLLLGLATAAFLVKGGPLRWVTLGFTFLLLGYVDGGFLSVSHILAGLSVGPSVYFADLPLLLLIGFTVLTTLFVGRIFCGFLCPFGALQDLLERVVPQRFRRELPRPLHERALLVKYGILTLVLAPVLIGSQVSLFQYFEPFGTVFYWSSSVLLWMIAGGILIASSIIPRFYCRYACPLGAALAIGSLVAPFRIRRVEQCDVCKVCEQKCPTGAIRGPRIDFKECVRCNVCETQLIKRTGACKHDMETIRSRLVRLPMAGAGAPDA